jgi:predicted transporter
MDENRVKITYVLGLIEIQFFIATHIFPPGVDSTKSPSVTVSHVSFLGIYYYIKSFITLLFLETAKLKLSAFCYTYKLN